MITHTVKVNNGFIIKCFVLSSFKFLFDADEKYA